MRDSALLSPSATRTPVQQQPMGMCLPGHFFFKNFVSLHYKFFHVAFIYSFTLVICIDVKI